MKAFPEWKSRIVRAFHRGVKQEELAHYTLQLHKEIDSTLEAAEVVITGATLVEKGEGGPLLPCPHCDHLATTRQALGAHLFHTHGHHCEERLFVQSSVCGGCLKNVRTSARLLQHHHHQTS